MPETENPKDIYIAPGTRVSYDGLGTGELEYGVVVHCWMSDELFGYDCYVAFFGDEFPKGQPKERPYILRYAATSLTVLP